MSKQQVVLGVGANLPSHAGQPADTIKAAIADLAIRAGKMLAVSPIYRTKAVTLDGDENVPDFVNGCVLIETSLNPDDLLDICKRLEADYGRMIAARWSARTLDIDLISYGDMVLPSLEGWTALAESEDPAAYTEEPMVPHPRAHKRAFVLMPMNDIAPNWQHPVLKQTVSELLLSMRQQGLCVGVKQIAAGI
ncbi:2-amino-4-hydroxy-6-hydroxymethyldihydropteridine diphosphokinase [Kordiimonas lipolytica]|uniref:2-amino-4-hydroxy-6-hydroxymethyldihydropteridine pyrophosphokinase n=1 Tax=Kordiimonas lipolytica TaxID=1662421 RepID=A0ABV8UF22_9PROT|nr:2-amino-4-hydroxy-6-hydroxymethyldihydropteridine diphosphokinase [Kordiimonas lipolytica]